MVKRGADRQITKDDESDEEENAPVEFGTFKKASDEVLKTRKIRRVKRGAAPPASNPFASIQLGLAQDNTARVVPQPTESNVTDAKVAEEVTTEVEEPKEDNKEGKGEGGGDGGESENVNGHAKAEKKTSENGENEEERKTATGTTELTSFQQVSSTPNAFGSFTSTSGFTFSTTSAFTFGSSTAFTFGGSSGAAWGSSSAGGFSFSAPSLSLSTAPSSSSGAEAPAVQPNYATVTLQEVPVETGEEKENAMFTSEAVLFEFVDRSWKERGKGEFKLNVSEDMKARLVMRSRGNLKLLLNAGLFPDMKTTKMDAKSVTFSCVNTAAAKEGLSTYALKVRDGGAVSHLMELIEQYKGVRASSVAPTPTTTEDNSQPASGAEEKSQAPSEEKSHAPSEEKGPVEAV